MTNRAIIPPTTSRGFRPDCELGRALAAGQPRAPYRPAWAWRALGQTNCICSARGPRRSAERTRSQYQGICDRSSAPPCGDERAVSPCESGIRGGDCCECEKVGEGQEHDICSSNFLAGPEIFRSPLIHRLTVDWFTPSISASWASVKPSLRRSASSFFGFMGGL